MTAQESFKRRVKARMARTGERYTAARQILIDRADRRARNWVSPPEMSDEMVGARTGRGWDEWCDLIEAWPGHRDGHPAIAAHLQTEHGLDGWWSQTVTVGYERIVGWRLPHQMADGTFTAGKSRTVTVDAAELRQLLLDDGHRRDLFPGETTELRSRSGSKSIRIAIGPGVAQITLDPVDGSPGRDRRVKVTVSHEKLPEAGDVDRWKHYWSEWLEAIEQE